MRCAERHSRSTCGDVQIAASDPARFGLGRRQCRLGQDACAGAARDPPAARGVRPGENSLHHLHQGGGRQHGEPRVRHARATGRRSTTPPSTRRSRRSGAGTSTPGAAGACAPAVCARAGDAGRPEGADHPRLLHPAAAPVSVRGERRGAFRGARRDARRRSCWTRLTAGRAARSRRRARTARSAGRSRTAITAGADQTFTRAGARSDRPARRASAPGSTRAGGVDEAIAELSRHARHRSRTTRSSSVEAEFFAGSLIRAVGVAAADRGAGAGTQERPRAGAHGSTSLAALTGRSASTTISTIFCTERAAAAQDASSRKAIASRSRAGANGCCAEQDRVCRCSARRNAVALPRPHRGAAHHRRRRCIARYRARKGAARPARLRRSDRQDAGAARAASTPPGCTTSSISASTTC